MDIRQLQYLTALARELHFQRAARAVNVSQPTLSQRIRSLEEELGVPLFERAPRRVRLTPAGEKFVQTAAGVLEALRKGSEEIASEKDARGTLRIGAIPTVCPYLLPPALVRLRRAAPRLTVELHEETTSLLIEHLKQGRIDVAVLALPVADRGISTSGILKEPFLLAVPSGHRLAARKTVEARDLRGERMLILQEGHCFRQQSVEYCKSAVKDPNIRFEGSSLTSVMRLAAAGEGVTLVPAMAVSTAAAGLKFVRFAPPAPEREIGIAWRVTSPAGAAHRAFASALEEAAARTR